MSSQASAGTINLSQQNNGSDRMSLPPALKEKTSKNLLYVAMVSMSMLFAGLTSAVIVSKGGNFWVNISLPNAFWISTGFIVLSSLTAILAQRAIAKNNQGATKGLLLITLVLGIGFGVSQFSGYKQLVDSGFFLTSRVMTEEGKFVPNGEYGKDFTISWKGEILKLEDGMFFTSRGPLTEVEKLKLISTRNTASSFLYFLTFLHLLHMLGGVIYLLFTTLFAFQNRFSSSSYLKIKLSNIYWHFLAFLWIYLFVFLQYIH